MADASRDLGYLHLVNVAQWHISDDNYVAARAAIVDAHHKHPMAAIWDDGTTSSSDGQYFRAAGHAGAGGSINAKYGIDPGAVIYTHVSGRYGPFYTRVISATMSEAPYVLDGLLHHVHQTDLRISEHYTDTAGATDHVFGLCHLLGYRFRTQDQGSEGSQALYDREALRLAAARAAGQRHRRNSRDPRPMGRANAPEGLH
jgi:TnpA family transposase